MDYDFRNRISSPYDSQIPMSRPTASSSLTRPIYGPHPSMYPKLGQPGSHSVNPLPGAARNPPFQPTSTVSGIGIRVALKPDYRITPPPQLSPQIGDIPRSNFHFDFDFERKILAEADKENQNWSRLGLENLPSRTTDSTSSLGSNADPVVSKYIASGLNREAVPLAVANYGDNPTKVREFVNGFTILREMGFSSNSVAEALLMYDNDTDKALAYFLNSSS
ncbi:hypothetical protein M9H77_26555 [Catharanthus roseus]|uniref:Uncharacterized protein n=1 Tax=Catharanthus roseus TaxID=4058 RepID=A0ACC0A9Z9_CATRO|nr:hypothetical protein M9H77_26555 [Catharanthus roseus]